MSSGGYRGTVRSRVEVVVPEGEGEEEDPWRGRREGEGETRGSGYRFRVLDPLVVSGVFGPTDVIRPENRGFQGLQTYRPHPPHRRPLTAHGDGTHVQ